MTWPSMSPEKATYSVTQSNRSVNPPWPGNVVAKSFIPYARFIAEAKNPMKGAAQLAKIEYQTV